MFPQARPVSECAETEHASVRVLAASPLTIGSSRTRQRRGLATPTSGRRGSRGHRTAARRIGRSKAEVTAAPLAESGRLGLCEGGSVAKAPACSSESIARASSLMRRCRLSHSPAECATRSRPVRRIKADSRSGSGRGGCARRRGCGGGRLFCPCSTSATSRSLRDYGRSEPRHGALSLTPKLSRERAHR